MEFMRKVFAALALLLGLTGAAQAEEPAYIPVAANPNDLILLDVTSIGPKTAAATITATILWVYKAPRPHGAAMVSYFIDTQVYDCTAGTATQDGLTFYDEAGTPLGSEPPSPAAQPVKPVAGGAGDAIIKSVCGGWRSSPATPMKGTQAAIDSAREILQAPPH